MPARRVLALGDLHLFSPQSDGEKFWCELPRQLEDQTDLVLLGDVFDFHWLDGLSVESALIESKVRLEELLTSAPEVKIHVLQGNHDCHPEYDAFLRELSERHERLTTHPLHLQIGDTAFLHGDAANRRMNESVLAEMRAEWGRKPPRRGLGAWVYRTLVKIGVDRLAGRLFFPEGLTCSRLLHYFKEAGISPKRIVFGHSHRRVDGVERNGVEFWNAGAPIGGRAFRAIRLEID